jgi:hypothetical protein
MITKGVITPPAATPDQALHEISARASIQLPPTPSPRLGTQTAAAVRDLAWAGQLTTAITQLQAHPPG